MDRIRIVGGNPLNGVIPISGAKNAALPLMIASLLTDDTLTLENLPHLADVEQLQRILGNHGVDIGVVGRRERQGEAYARTVHFTARTIVDTTAPYELVSKMRASFWVIGPLLARMGEARVSLPGGCAIGTRPVDLFIDGLEHLGAEIEIENGYINARAPKGLIGGRYVFPKVSVGATHVLMMAATLAKGQTVIENAAQEPEVADLAKCLIAMGAKISGAGTSTGDRWRDIALGCAPQGAAGPHRDRNLCHGSGHDRRRRASGKHLDGSSRERTSGGQPRRCRHHA
jgi:UDP-N-acetylglucosamine 1-carboxyvinyltransferase